MRFFNTCFAVITLAAPLSAFSETDTEGLGKLADFCAAICDTGSIIALPATYYGVFDFLDRAGFNEIRVYDGLSNQPMTNSEINKTLIEVVPAFEKNKQVLVHDSLLNTKRLSLPQFEEKLRQRKKLDLPVKKIAIKIVNDRMLKGLGLLLGITHWIFIEYEESLEKEAIAAEKLRDRAKATGDSLDKLMQAGASDSIPPLSAFRDSDTVPLVPLKK